MRAYPDLVLRVGVAGRGAGFALLTVPSVALAHLAVSGTLPPAPAMLLVALAAVLMGAVTTGRRAGSGLAGAQLLGHLAIFLSLGGSGQGCLPVMGRGAELGLRLAVLRESTSCAPGQLAIGTVPATTLTLILLAAAVLLWQLLAAGLGSILLHAAGQLVTAANALAAAAGHLIGALALALLVAAGRLGALASSPLRWTPAEAPRPLTSRFSLTTDPQRGPPALLAS